jgi:hypothetical protein
VLFAAITKYDKKGLMKNLSAYFTSYKRLAVAVD